MAKYIERYLVLWKEVLFTGDHILSFCTVAAVIVIVKISVILKLIIAILLRRVILWVINTTGVQCCGIFFFFCQSAR